MKHILSISYFFITSSILFVLSLTIANAQNAATGELTIIGMDNWGHRGDEGMRIRTSTNQTNPTNPASCSNSAQYWLSDATSDISRSMVLSAAATGAPLAFVIAGGSACSDSGYPVIVNVAFPVFN